MAQVDNYSNYPPSTTEIQADRENNGSKLTARDALIMVLREIDSGRVNPRSLIVVYGDVNNEDGSSPFGYVQATAGATIAVGLLQRAAFTINSNTR